MATFLIQWKWVEDNDPYSKWVDAKDWEHLMKVFGDFIGTAPFHPRLLTNETETSWIEWAIIREKAIGMPIVFRRIKHDIT